MKMNNTNNKIELIVKDNDMEENNNIMMTRMMICISNKSRLDMRKKIKY